MLEVAKRQHVDADRVSFIDAVRWLCCTPCGHELASLIVNPMRPGRVEPRVIKRRMKNYRLMTKPRPELREALMNRV